MYTCLTSAPRVPSYLECCSVTSLCVHVSRHKPPVTLSTHHGLSQASQCSMVTSFHFMSPSALTAICLHLAAAPANKTARIQNHKLQRIEAPLVIKGKKWKCQFHFARVFCLPSSVTHVSPRVLDAKSSTHSGFLRGQVEPSLTTE